MEGQSMGQRREEERVISRAASGGLDNSHLGIITPYNSTRENQLTGMTGQLLRYLLRTAMDAAVLQSQLVYYWYTPYTYPFQLDRSRKRQAEDSIKGNFQYSFQRGF
jgi:hypothetical protein